MSPSPDASALLDDWFNREVAPHATQLRRYLLAQFGARIDVDDVLQEAFLRLWRSAQVRPVHHGKAMLYVVARNVALSHLRRRGAAPIVDVSADYAATVLDERPGVEEVLHRRDRLEQLERAIDALPQRTRQVLRMRRIEGRRCREIATILGISEGTVETQMTRALRICSAFAAAQPV